MNIYLKNYLVKSLLKKGVGRKKLLEIAKKGRYKREIDYIAYLKKEKISVISFDEPQYPELLKEIHDFPIFLFAKGNVDFLNQKIFTIVGTRNISKYGERVVDEFLEESNGYCFASGLARGVDAEVHKKCLERNIPTIAVVAGGLYEGFPKSNAEIFEEICKKGLVISEFPPGREIVKGMFPMRNRILAGMSVGTLVVESDIDGGSMITANLSLEYGREVCAVPGNIFKNTSRGCNSLINDGAKNIVSKEELKSLLKDCIQ
jgi:DNA processing protein